MPPTIVSLAQAAVEYGAATSSAAQTTGGNGGSTLGAGTPVGNAMARLQGPVGLGLLGAFVLWLLLRGRGGTSLRGLLGHALIAAVGLSAAYAIAVWKHLL